MQSINNAANAASKAIWGDSSTQSGQEPVSGQTGSGTANEPYDGGNTTDNPRLAGLPGDDARPAFSTGRDIGQRGSREDGADGGSTYGSDNPYTGAGAGAGAGAGGGGGGAYSMNRGGPDSNSAGPHPVSIANKLDPRVASDGDRETTAIPGTSTTGSDYSSFTTGQSGTTDNYGTTDDYGNSPQSTSEGPRSSNIAGRFAPDVSSDRDGSSSYGTTAGYSNNQQSTSEGPNSSNIAGRFAPNVGSDRDGSRTMGSNTAVDTSSSSRMTGSDSTSTRVTGQDDTSTGPTGGMAQGANATGGRPRPEHETDKTGVTSMHSNDPKFSDQRQSEAGSSSVDTRGQSKGPTGGFGAVEPSVSADPSSGQKPMQKEQGADRPNEEPSGEQADAVRAKKEATENVQAGNDTGAGSKETGGKETKKDPNDHSGEPLGAVDHSGSSEKKPAGQEGGDPHGEDKSNKGTGEKWVKTTGMAADGGDFDATKPGAGKEAERLLEEKGIHRDPGAGKPATDPNAPDPHDSATKEGMGQKIKEKLHLGSH